MRKNQKFSKEEMYLAIDLWQESGLSQREFCLNENLSVKTFAYWLRKHKQEKGFQAKKDNNVRETFIPVDVPNAINTPVPGYGKASTGYVFYKCCLKEPFSCKILGLAKHKVCKRIKTNIICWNTMCFYLV